MENVDWTEGTLFALLRACEDRELSEIIGELGGNHLVTALHMISGSESTDTAFRQLKHYYLTEMSRRQADQDDLGFRNFTEDERQLLGISPKGQELLPRMRDGDDAAVAKAQALVREITDARDGLGLP